MNQANLSICPKVPAQKSADGVLLIVDPCPHCGGRHCHGAGGGYGHRWAHCPDKGSFGYELVEEGFQACRRG